MARYIDCDKCYHGRVCAYRHQYHDMIVDCNHYKPTADVEEVKHSRWENISGFDVCNICGTSPAYWEPKPNNPKGYPPYCHNCGAKMDGGKEE